MNDLILKTYIVATEGGLFEVDENAGSGAREFLEAWPVVEKLAAALGLIVILAGIARAIMAGVKGEGAKALKGFGVSIVLGVFLLNIEWIIDILFAVGKLLSGALKAIAGLG